MTLERQSNLLTAVYTAASICMRLLRQLCWEVAMWKGRLVIGVLALLISTSAFAQLNNVPAVPSENGTDSWAQRFGNTDKDCLNWTDSCVNCLRSRPNDNFFCSNIGVACQPKEVKCLRRYENAHQK